MTPGERALAERVRGELKALAYPDRAWVRPVDGCVCSDVLVVGGGQSGLAIAHGLRRDGVSNVAVLDARPAGKEGVWEHFARMSELRTPKEQSGIEFGQPSLSVRAWHAARFGAAAWEGFRRVPRQDWAAYLRWYRATLDLPVENDVSVVDIGPGPRPDLVAVETSGGTRLARSVVLATGFEGAGIWRVPEVISAALPCDRYDHACMPIDFSRFAGQRIGILGHGASAFDAAVVALQAGAASVDLCFRRAALPVVNPHRFLDGPGLMAHWPSLSDRVRWNIARHMRIFDQPPGVASFEAAVVMPGFRMHAGCPWESVAIDGQQICAGTPRGLFRFDHVICATGYAFDLGARPELRRLADRVVLWRDRFDPVPEEAHPELGAYPYLDAGYGFTPRAVDLDCVEVRRFGGMRGEVPSLVRTGRAMTVAAVGDDWMARVHAFNFAAFVSAGPHSTSISGHKHALPRLLRALVRRLFLEQENGILEALRTYDELDLVMPEGISA